MNEKILELEKSLFKLEFMHDKDYLNNILDEDYLEIGKSGRFINKFDAIDELINTQYDRNIDIYNFTCTELNKNIFIVHYITISQKDKIFRTSIWKKDIEYKIIFHQASKLLDEVKLIKC